MPTLIGKRSEMTTADWLAQRQIGSSNAATVLNINPFQTPYQLWSELVSLVPAFIETEDTRSGKYLQPAVANWFADETGLRIEEAEELWRHDEHPFMTATPDYYVWENDVQGILEVKTTASHNWKQWEHGPPTYYRAQVLHQLEVRRLPFAYIACLIGGKRLVYHRIEFDAYGQMFCQDVLIPSARAFVEMVEKKIPPAVTSDDCGAVLEAHPSASANRLALPDEMANWALTYDEARSGIKFLEKQKDAAQAALMQFIGNAEGADSEEWITSWKNKLRGGLDQKRLKAERPEIWEAYKLTGTTRSFSLKRKTKEEDDE